MKRSAKIAVAAGAALAAGGVGLYLISKKAAPTTPAPPGGQGPSPTPQGSGNLPGGPSAPAGGGTRVNLPGGIQNMPQGGVPGGAVQPVPPPLVAPPVAVTLSQGQAYAFSVASSIPTIPILGPEQTLAGALGLAGFTFVTVDSCFPSDFGGNVCNGFATWSGLDGASPPSILDVTWLTLTPTTPVQAGQH